MDQLITEYAFPPAVWSLGEVVVDSVQISAANLQAGSYAAGIGLYSPYTEIRASFEAVTSLLTGHRVRLLEFQLEPRLRA